METIEERIAKIQARADNEIAALRVEAELRRTIAAQPVRVFMHELYGCAGALTFDGGSWGTLGELVDALPPLPSVVLRDACTSIHHDPEGLAAYAVKHQLSELPPANKVEPIHGLRLHCSLIRKYPAEVRAEWSARLPDGQVWGIRVPVPTDLVKFTFTTRVVHGEVCVVNDLFDHDFPGHPRTIHWHGGGDLRPRTIYWQRNTNVPAILRSL